MDSIFGTFGSIGSDDTPAWGGAREGRRPLPAKAKVTDRLYRNSTSFPAKMTAMLRNLYREYKTAQEDPAAREHAWAALLKYYQFVVRRVMTDPEYGIGSEGNARGLLLAHGMGMGKTMAATAIAMALWDVRQPVVVLARSLQQNFLDTVAKVVAITQRGLPAEELAARQAAAQARFSFVTLDAYNMADQLGRAGTREKAHRGGPATGLTVGALDGKLLIVDEAHNLFRAIINSGSETTNARRFYSMVQEARDLRLVFLTGTPASKDPFELVPCFNMLAGSDLLPPQYEVFTKLYVDREGRRVKNRDKLANRLVGLVSFVTHSLPTEPTPESLRTRLEDIPIELAAEEAGVEPPESIIAASTGPRRERDDGWFPERKPLVIDRVEMGGEQYRWYLLAREKEEAEGKGGQGGPRKEGVLAAPALALPGAEKKAMRSYYVRSRTLSNYALPREMAGRPIEEVPPDGFAPERGPKLARAAERAAAAPGPVLAYSQFVEHGLKALAGFLRRAGFVEWTPGAHGSAPAYAIISGEVDLARRAEIKNAFNAADNLHGERLKALLVSKTGAEGLDLKNIREVHILEPYWDKAREDQVIFRAVRLGSHDMLPREEREVASYLYVAAPNSAIFANIPPANREAKTIDELFHERALTKYEINRDFRKLLSEVSLECSLLGYGSCRMCVPTDAVLFHDDPALDLRIPNPCEPMRSQEVDVREIRVAVTPGAEPRTYYFADDPSSPLGVRFYEFREDLDGYAEIDLAESAVDALLRAVRGQGAAPTGGAANTARGHLGLVQFHRAWLTPEERAAAERELRARGTCPSLFLGVDAPGIPYRRGSYEQRLSLHVGQRKLLLTEIAFLALCSQPGDTVVYAGSAPGTHVPFLAELFGTLRFILYDPREFDMSRAQGPELDRIELHQALFTDDVARGFSGREDVLFVSDIRTGSTGPTQEDDEAFERAVEENMTMQMRWCQLMRPRKASLKFRLPYRGGQTRYLAGQILVQPWAPDNSSETRLIAGPDYDTLAEYDADLYNAQMYYINAILRQWKFYDHGVPVDKARGMDHCFDCALEAAIWRLFLGGPEKRKAAHDTEIARLVAATTQHLRRPLLVPPHGKMVDAPADKRRDVLLGFRRGGADTQTAEPFDASAET